MHRRLRERAKAATVAGKKIAYWLNDVEHHHLREQSGDKKRIARLIHQLQSLDKFARAAVSLMPMNVHDGPSLECAKELRRLEDEVYRSMRRYSVRPLFLANYESGIETAWQPLRGGSDIEWEAIEELQDIVRAGKIHSLVLCPTCQKRWVYKIREMDKYCGDTKCRQKPYEARRSKSPARRKYHREYYRDNFSSDRRKYGKKK